MNQFFKRYKSLIGEDVSLLMKCRGKKLPKTIRVNTLRVSDKVLVDRLQQKMQVEKIDFLPHGYRVHARFSLGATPEYLQGYYYLQEAAAQLPVSVMPVKSGVVLDMAAAPGGKTTQLAAVMRNTGSIVALDRGKRIVSLQNNLERLGVRNTFVLDKDARSVDELDVQFDSVLLDAPCSGNFMTDSKWFDKRKVKQFVEKSVVQKELLEAGLSVLKRGGSLVYSTCSLEPEENELVVQWALDTFAVQLEKIDCVGDDGLIDVFGDKLDDEVKKSKRLWPHKTGTQGFFIARFKKKR